MKFWVKAIVDSDIQEQLLVEASTTEELHSQLSKLLDIQIDSISVQDFQSQVVDKLAEGEDIITVHVKSIPDESKAKKATEDSYSSFARPSSRSGDIDGRRRNTAKEKDEPNEDSMSSLYTALSATQIGSSPGSLSPFAASSRRTSSKTAVHDSTPTVERLCLTRDNLLLLLHRRFGNRFISDIIGCFVRVLEPGGYCIYQIVDLDTNGRLILDTVHSKEARSLDTVSNAPPVKTEISAWLKSMLNSFRSFPTVGFIEAKSSDIESALSSATSALQVTQPAPERSNSQPTPSPSSVSPRRKKATLSSRRATFQHVPQGGLPSTRIVVRTNDVLENVAIRTPLPANELTRVTLFATRHSNATQKREKLSDFSGCCVSLNSASDHSIVSDRDITEKGILLLSPPLAFEGLYYSFGLRFKVDHSSTYTEEDGTLVQDFLILSGSTTHALTPYTPVSLPIPTWALNNGFDPVVISPKLIVMDRTVHVFYLVRVRLDSDVGPVKKSATFSVSPKVPKRTSKDKSQLDLPVPAADDEDPSTLNQSLDFGSVTAVNSPNVSLEVSFTSAQLPTTGGVSNECYMLSHAVSTIEMESWEVISDRESLIQCSELPLFDVEVVEEGQIGLLYYTPEGASTNLSPLFQDDSSTHTPSYFENPFKLNVFSTSSKTWSGKSITLDDEVAPTKLCDHLRSISLFKLGSDLYLGTAHRSVKSKMLIFIIPLCLESNRGDIETDVK